MESAREKAITVGWDPPDLKNVDAMRLPPLSRPMYRLRFSPLQDLPQNQQKDAIATSHNTARTAT
jgi:hypothetical protein